MVAERKVRGTTERTYVLRTAAASISLEELSKMTKDEHRQAFLAYVAGLVGDFDQYLSREKLDPLRDGVSYNLAAMWLDDGELNDLAREMLKVIQPRLANAPKKGRKRRILGTVLIPGPETR